MANASSLGNVSIIATRAALRGNSAIGLPPVIFLQGTSAPLDGGQGFYAVNLTDKTTADNGTSVIVDGAGYRWELVTADTLSQIIASLTVGGTLPALDPILGGSTTVAAAATTDVSALTQAVATVTGSGVSIAALGTLGAGRLRILTFADVNTLVHNATSLILPGAANITTAAGDIAGFISLGSGNWQCAWYTAADGYPGVVPIAQGGTGQITAVAANIALSPKGADIASAATINLALATGPVVDITGSTGPVTSLGTVAAGARFRLRFMSTPTLTHNAVSLILPGGANITAAAGDTAEFVSLGSGNWYCDAYQRASGLQLAVNTIALGGTGQSTAVAAYDALGVQGANIAAAATTDLGAADGQFVNVTGSGGPITALGTATAGVTREVKFTGAPILTYNATSLILPGVANIQVAANDSAQFVSLGSGNWICTRYTVAAERPYVEGTFTPTAAFGTPGDAAFVYSTQTGQYTRIGNLVQFTLQLAFTVTHTTASGNLLISAPFTAANVDPNQALSVALMINFALGATLTLTGAAVAKNSANITVNLRTIATEANTVISTVTTPSGATTYTIRIGGSFRAAA